MKKTIFALLCLITALMLCSCCLSHEWADATCLTAKTCTRCGETEGEPLGHSWTDATCTAPQTCAACGVTEGTVLEHSWADATCEAPKTCTACGGTEGEALGHTYGQWDFGEKNMTRTCAVCSGTETAKTDRELWLRQTLEGSWDLVMEVQDNYITFEQSIDGFRPQSLIFHGDNQGYWYLGTEALAVTWGDAKASDANPGLLSASLKTADQSVSTTIYVDPIEETLYFFTSKAEYLVFARNQALTQALTGYWADIGSGVDTLKLSADHTFTGSIERYNRDIKKTVYEDISGIWHVSPEYDYGGLTFCDLCLSVNKDGNDEEYMAAVYLGVTQSYSSDSLQHEQLEMTLSMDYSSLSFDGMDDEAYAELEYAMRYLPCGPWTSNEIQYNGGSIRETDAYSINFAEDGTFTAVLDTQRTGTWTFETVDMDDRGAIHCCIYRLIFDGIDDYFLFFTYNDGDTYLSFGRRNCFIYFQQMTEEKIAEREAIRADAAERIVGCWSALEMSTHFSDDSGWQTKNMLDYNITFAADGTFTATLDQEYTGTWTYDRTRVETWDPDFPQTYHTYELCFDGIPDSIEVSIRVSCYEDSPDIWEIVDYPDAFVAREADGCLEVDHTAQDGTSYSLALYRLSEESLEEIRADREALIGTWRGQFVTTYNRVTGKPKQLPVGDYTLQIFADGTFTAQLDQPISGYWYYDHSSYDGAEYVFYCSDVGTITGIKDDGSFMLHLIFGDMEYSANMIKD